MERGFKVSLAESGVGCNLSLCWDAGGVELGKCVVFALVTVAFSWVCWFGFEELTWKVVYILDWVALKG